MVKVVLTLFLVLAQVSPVFAESGNLAAKALFDRDQIAEPSSGASLVSRMFQGLGLSVGAFLIGIALYRKYKGVGASEHSGRKLKVLERIPINSKTALCLVKCADREFLVSVGPDKVQMQELLDNGGSELSYEEPCATDYQLSS